MNNKKYIVLMIVLVTIGSIYTVGSNSNEMNFCVWGFACADNITEGDDSWDGLLDEIIIYYPMDFTLVVNKFENYSFTEEGIVISTSSVDTVNKAFFKSVEEVVAVSRRDYQEIITAVSAGEDFDDIYHGNIKIFRKKYTTLLDQASSTGEYIQNIGELVMNGYEGDCDDYALFLYLVAKERGLDVRYVSGIGVPSGHAWIQVKVDGDWKEYDSTSDRICDDCVSEDFYFIDYFEEGNPEEDEDDI